MKMKMKMKKRTLKLGDRIPYKDDVIGQRLSIMFTNESDGKDEFYNGIITKLQIELDKKDKESLLVQHFVIFDDGEEMWFDLAEEEWFGRLRWKTKNLGRRSAFENSIERKKQRLMNDDDHHQYHKKGRTLRNGKYNIYNHHTHGNDDDDRTEHEDEEEEEEQEDQSMIRRRDQQRKERGKKEKENREKDDVDLEEDEEDQDHNNNYDQEEEEWQRSLDDDEKEEEREERMEEGVIVLKPEELAKLNSLERILRYMDEVEPFYDFFGGQYDGNDTFQEVYIISSKLRHFARRNPNHLAVRHWVATKKWRPPSNAALQALINLIKSMSP